VADMESERYGQRIGDYREAAERGRLDLLATVFDPSAQRSLKRLRVVPGRRCLEVGPGAGSLSSWLLDEGASSLTLVDLETSLLHDLADRGAEVINSDIGQLEFPRGTF
jgi:16S rRNA A1518/A1519 N6-dimethyltransferase RsmA/KsgA/DIM1 with predicted DNA glycosylase/AP lyase activity